LKTLVDELKEYKEMHDVCRVRQNNKSIFFTYSNLLKPEADLEI
jgi:hypothetical protein